MAGSMRARYVRTNASSKAAPATLSQGPLGSRFSPGPALSQAQAYDCHPAEGEDPLSSQLPAPPGQADGQLVSSLLGPAAPPHASGLTGAEQEPGLILKRQTPLFVTTRPNEPFRIGRVPW